MKLNMGCGFNKDPDFINVDAYASCEPDVVCDLESTPWPWEDSVAESVVFNHSLEHMGETTSVFLKMMQELYRICKPEAEVVIIVPHPRHDYFIGDPTHVRIITPLTLTHFDKSLNDQWVASKSSNTPLAHYLGVDFRIEKVGLSPDESFLTLLNSGKISQQELDRLAKHNNNILNEYRFTLRVKK